MKPLTSAEDRAVKTLEHFLKEKSPSDARVKLVVEPADSGYSAVVAIRAQEFEFFLDLGDMDVDTLLQRLRGHFTDALGQWHRRRRSQLS